MYSCPKCGETDNLRILIRVWIRLIQPEEEPEDFETELIDGDHEWDDQSQMECQQCGQPGTVAEFEVDEDDDLATEEDASATAPADVPPVSNGFDGDCPF